MNDETQTRLITIGLAVAGYLLFTTWGGGMNELWSTSGGWPKWGGIAMTVLGVLGFIGSFLHDPVPVLCSDCGQYLGPSSGFQCPCPRCGCNRYTTHDDGVGRTYRSR